MIETSPNALIGAMEALDEGMRRAAHEAFTIAPEALEHRIAVQAHLVRQCSLAFPRLGAAVSPRERERISAIASRLRHSTKVYRLVMRSAQRSTNALLRIASPANRGALELGA